MDAVTDYSFLHRRLTPHYFAIFVCLAGLVTSIVLWNVLRSNAGPELVRLNAAAATNVNGALGIADAAFATGIVFTALLSLLAYFSRKSSDQRVELSFERAVRTSLSTELAQTELAIEDVITCSSEPVLAVDPVGSIIWQNSAAESLFGFEHSELNSKNVLDLFHFHETTLDDGMAGLARQGEVECITKNKDNSSIVRTVSISTSQSGKDPLYLVTLRDTRDRRLSQKAMEGIIRALKKSQTAALNILDDLSRERKELQRINALLTDEIAERKKMEQQLLHANAELHRKNGELDAFAYVASHDLKEPLRGIHNYSKFLLEDYGPQLDEESLHRLTTVTKLTTRLDSLIDHLLHYSRVGRSKLAEEDISLEAVVVEVRELLGSSFDDGNVTLKIETPLATIRGDRVLVAELYQNLVSNAIKYSGGRASIGIGIVSRPDREIGDQLTCYVRDKGIGIPEQHLEDVFRIFKRLHGRNEYGGGAGAGLTISRKIVERHGGVIWAESQQGEGSTFYFTLSRSEG